MGSITKLSKEDEALVQRIEDVSLRRYIRNDLKRNYNEINYLKQSLNRVNNSESFFYKSQPQSVLQAKIDYHRTIIKTVREELLKCNETGISEASITQFYE